MKIWSIVATAILAIPFYYLWNYLAPIYAPTWPDLYKAIPFWDCVAGFALIGVIRAALSPWGHGGWWRHHHGWHHRH